MAVLTWEGSVGLNLKTLDLDYLVYVDNHSRGPNLFSANYDSPGSSRNEFRGCNFSYDGNGIPIGGVVTKYASFSFGRKLASIDGMSVAVTSLVSAASTATTADDLAVYKAALSGNARIIGGNANDKLAGFAGKDVLIGGRGSGRLYGGLGTGRFAFPTKADSAVSRMVETRSTTSQPNSVTKSTLHF